MPLEALLVLVILLVVVTVVGHVIWITLAWIGRAVMGSESKDAHIHLPCPWCEQPTTVHQGRCQWCGRALFDNQARGVADLAAVRRKVQEWQSRGKLGPEQAKALLLEVESQRRVAMGLSPLLMTTVKPTPAKPAPEKPSPAKPEPTRPPVPLSNETPIQAILVEPPTTEIPKTVVPKTEPPRVEPPKPVPAPPAPRPAAQPQRPTPPQVAAARSAPTAPAVRSAPTLAPAPAPTPQRPAAPARPVVEEPPQRSWRELIQTFLEEREIPAIELFGVLLTSLLIVAGAVILVIYFWETLQEYPVLKFSAFSAGAIGSMLLGLLACIRWQLKTTGRGLLGISLLLVPLSFLVVASSGSEPTVIIAELGAIALFAYLITLAGKVLVPDRPWHLAAAILVPVAAVVVVSAAPWLVSRFWSVGLFGTVTVAAFATPLVLHRRIIAKLDDVGLPTLIGAFFLLGASLFPLAFALGLAAKTATQWIGGIALAIDALSVALSLLAATILAFSLTLTLQLEHREKLASWRAASTALGLTSALGMLAGLLLAWPWSSLLFAVALLDTAVLLWIAVVCRFPWIHAGAMATGAAACLMGYHLLAGNLPWGLVATPAIMIHAIFGGTSAAVLVAFSGLLAGVAAWFARTRQADAARVYAWGTGVTAVVSLVGSAAAAWFEGGTSIPLAMVVFTIYGSACLVGNCWVRVPAVSHVGLSLLAGATMWAMYWLSPTPSPVWAAVVGIEALALASAGWGLKWFVSCESQQPEGCTPTASAALVEAYRGPLLDVADALAGLTLAIAALVLLPHLRLYTYTAWPAVALVSAAGAWLIGAWNRGSVERTWAGSATVLLALIHTFVYCLPGWLQQPWLDSVLTHATLGIAATLVCQLASRTSGEAFRNRLHKVLVEPLSQSAGLSSALALPLLLVNSWEHMLTLSLCLFWLAAIWLVVAAVNRLPGLVTGAQAVMCLASLAAGTAWLQQCSWNTAGRVDFSDLRTWQVYGLTLAILILAWTIARVALRRVKLATELLNPEWPSLDRLVGGTLCVAQLFVAAGAMLPAVGYELGSGPASPALALQAAVASPAAWLLLVALTTCCAVGAWSRWRESELLAALLVFGALPWLLAAQWGANTDAASVLRWAAAGTLILGTGAVCLRRPLAAWAGSVGIHLETTESSPQIARSVLLGLTLLPVLGVTLYSAGAQLTGVLPTGPVAGTFFHSLGTKISYLVPLVAVVASLIVLAWRESSSGYAFSAGLVTKLSVVLACLLSFTKWGPDQWAVLWYSVAVTSAVWAAAWITARRWINVWREDRLAPALLMRLELAMGAVAAAAVLVPGLFALLGEGLGRVATLSTAAGSWLGWVAVGSIVAAAVYRQFDRRLPVPADLAGLVGLTFIGLVACTVSSLVGPLGLSAYGVRWGFHTMLIGWAAYSVLIALSTWWMAEHVRVPGAEGPPQVLIRAANTWVIVSGMLAVLLGLLAAIFFDPSEERLWGSAAIGLASAASATMAVWRRREAWAFVSGLGVNVAASFTVSYFEPALDTWHGFLLLVQANVIAGAVVALTWLAVRKRLYALRDKAVWSGPLLALQIGLTAVGALALVVPTMAALVASPNDLPLDALRQIGSAPGATAVLLAALAAGWHLLQLRRREVIHAVGATALAGGVLLGAGSVGWADWFAQDVWLPYHVTIAAWAALGLTLLAAAGAVHFTAKEEDRHQSPLALAADMLPAEPACLWHFALTLAAAAAGLTWCAADPGRPHWAAGVMLAGALGAGAVALWRHRVAEIILSGVFINLAGNVAWIAWHDQNFAGLIETNVLCLAAGATLWTILQVIVPRRVANITLDRREFSYAELALQAALLLLGGLAVVLVGMTLAGADHPGATPLTWWSVLAVAGALVLRLVSRSKQFTLPGLYYLGLISIALSLDSRAESARHLLWLAGPELAGFALAAALVYALLWALDVVRQGEEDDESHYGVLHVQWVLVGLAAVLGAMTALHTGFGEFTRPVLAWLAPGRWSGPLAALALLPAAWLTAQSMRSTQASAWRFAALIAGALLAATVGWAWLPAADANLLNQTVVVLVAAVVMILVSGVGLPRLLSENSLWVDCSRKTLAGFAGTGAVALVSILLQEMILFDPVAGAPMATWAVIVVAAAMACMLVGLIAFAVSSTRDPLGLTEDGRTAYVYAAEVLGGLIALHLWLTEPTLFQIGIIEQYWMLLVIGIAFLGVGLSEWFHRLGLPVLSRPLANTAALLPLVPAIGYWIPTGVVPASALAGDSPAVWFCGSLFYAVMATTQRSRLYSFLSLGTLAAAFCLLWQKMELGFTEHVQLYGIPIGIAILLAEQIHHRELKPPVASAMRYIALTCIYLTSSAEFLWELGTTIWLPLTLIALSVLGILAGIFLRIRSFVIVGFTSLALVVGALVYDAAVNQQQAWVFAVALLALGIPLLAFFMVFEKKKAQILAAVNRFWNWERRELVLPDRHNR
ncbi:MAG: hypothetical protein GXX96_28505 [Planctomycetaceae bacterium]|nr:hypothetical protein [Planctomycetaceae bacterium]